MAKEFSKWIEKTVGKGEIAHYKQFLLFPHSVFKRLILQTRKNQGLFGKGLTLSQTTNFRLFWFERLCRQRFQIWRIRQKVLQRGRKALWEKEKLLVTSNFFFSHSVFKRLILQTRKNQGLFGKEFKVSCLTLYHTIPIFNNLEKEAFWKQCGKRRKCWKPAFSPFPTMFSTLPKTNFSQI